MRIFIRDEQGLPQVLMMNRFTQDQINEAKKIIRSQFREAATKVFQDILEKPLPDNIEVNLSLSDNDELKRKTSVRLASFNSDRSSEGNLYFTIHEISFKRIIKQGNDTLFKVTVFHEMFHAADLLMLKNQNKTIEELRNRLNENYVKRNNYDTQLALLHALNILYHYRDEGVAVLGECLLTKTPLNLEDNPINRFKDNFKITIERSSKEAEGISIYGYSDDIKHNAYEDAPFVLLFVLHKLGCIDQALAQKAIHSIGTQNFELTDEESKKILLSAFELTLSSYIKGLMLMCDKVAHVLPFLYFCCKLQFEFELGNLGQLNDELSNAKAFADLIKKPGSTNIFNTTMDQIMGCCIPEEKLDKLVHEIINSPDDDPSFSEQKKRVLALYDFLKNENDSDRKLIAQWALTYFFDDEDVIHDDIHGMGFVDDLVVLDYALNLLHCQTPTSNQPTEKEEKP